MRSVTLFANIHLPDPTIQTPSSNNKSKKLIPTHRRESFSVLQSPKQKLSILRATYILRQLSLSVPLNFRLYPIYYVFSALGHQLQNEEQLSLNCQFLGTECKISLNSEPGKVLNLAQPFLVSLFNSRTLIPRNMLSTKIFIRLCLPKINLVYFTALVSESSPGTYLDLLNTY